MIAGVCLRHMATDGTPIHDKTWVKRCGLKRGDNSMLCKVNWSAECLLTNYFSKVVSINCYNILCYQFVVLSLISSKEKKKTLGKKQV